MIKKINKFLARSYMIAQERNLEHEVYGEELISKVTVSFRGWGKGVV